MTYIVDAMLTMSGSNNINQSYRGLHLNGVIRDVLYTHYYIHDAPFQGILTHYALCNSKNKKYVCKLCINRNDYAVFFYEVFDVRYTTLNC